MTSDSLSGQNKGRRAAGIRSSRIRSKLWQRLRDYDRRCTVSLKKLPILKLLATPSRIQKEIDRFNQADHFRKNIRWKLKHSTNGL